MDEEDSASFLGLLDYENIYTYAIYLFGGLVVLTIVIWCACIFCCNCLGRKKVNKNNEDDDILAADPSMSKSDLINLKKRREKEKLAK